jgi:hypothetical protein
MAEQTNASPTVTESFKASNEVLIAAALDADILDDFFLRVLLQSFLAEVKPIHRHLISSSSSTSSIIQLISKSALPLARIISIFICRGQTPSLSLLGLKRVTRHRHDLDVQNGHNNVQSRPGNISMSRLAVYTTLSIFLPEAYQWIKQYLMQKRPQRLQQMIQSRAWHEEDNYHTEPQHAPTGIITKESNRQNIVNGNDNHNNRNNDNHRFIPTTTQELAWARQERVSTLGFQFIDKFIPTVQLVSLLLCWSGRSSTPSAAMLLSGLRLENVSSGTPFSQSHISNAAATTRTLSVDLAHRRWLYHQLAQTARLLWIGFAMMDTVWSPLSRERWQRLQIKLKSALRKLHGRMLAEKDQIGDADEQRLATKALLRECLLCHASPIVMPVEADCSCRGKYCYTCLYHYSRRNQGRHTQRDHQAVKCLGCGGGIYKSRLLS